MNEINNTLPPTNNTYQSLLSPTRLWREIIKADKTDVSCDLGTGI